MKFLFPLTLFYLFCSCAPKEYELNCGPEDQWKAYTSPLESKSGNTLNVDNTFSDEQKADITHAVSKWNEEATSAGKPPIFSISYKTFSSSSIPSSKGCNFDGNPREFNLIRIEDPALTLWKSFSFTEANPAVTLRCAVKGKPVDKQVILFNHNLYSASQFKTIMLHELGHAAGLDHSCTFNDSDGFVNCVGLSKEHPYRQAVMYPTLSLVLNSSGVSAPETKDLLKENDKVRAQCVLNAEN